MRKVLPAMFLLAMCCQQLRAEDQAWIDPQTAAAEDPDFVLQGEYATPRTSEKEGRIYAQVIALGKHHFRLVRYVGGLPGAGWDGEAPMQYEADAQDNAVHFKGPNSEEVLTLADGKIESSMAGDPALKIERLSPTLGAKPPEGATVLFDGTKETFEKQWKNSHMSDDGLLMQGATTNMLVQDCTLHVEFRLPYKPDARGQGRGNSGLYLQSRYEVQMLDSFGLKGEDNECGGIYRISKPKVNMCAPPLTWQTYDVDFTAAEYDANGAKTANAKITVRHNGVIIQENVEIGGRTTSSPLAESPEPGPIYLQNHGNPVRYRNIWIIPR
ncbi:MAG: DUF1080 domain-containing protein [Planctomycetes bacterium]|nr:DUF1080 domain-containing protein [Planctomycetota bacterium]